MNAILLNVWDRIRSSYWFMPSLFMIGSITLAVMIPMFETNFGGTMLPAWLQTTTEAARTTLSTMAGAMVAVTGTVFSITIVVLSLTSQQFGPRLLRRFMHDLPTQITLGVFLGTGTYCLLVLSLIEQQDERSATLHLSTAVAVALVLVSMGMLIFFIHHITTMIQAPNVVSAVARDLDDAILRIFPEQVGRPVAEKDNEADMKVFEADLGAPEAVIPANCDGYVQAIDGDGLVAVAHEKNLILRLTSKPGDFQVKGASVAEIWKSDNNSLLEDESDELIQRINGSIIVGNRRTPRQDVECAVNELVEVAVRSLSPGINDPFTAMNSIDRLGASLERLVQREVPSAYRSDEEGNLRVIAQPLSISGVLDAAFDQIRQYSPDSVAVTLRILEAFELIANQAERPDDLDNIRLHAEMVARNCENWTENNDRQSAKCRKERIIDCLRAKESHLEPTP